ncbi:N-acetyl-gamma-glutamyl-phosphate reductase [Corynebacterium epidermidicanis]|uniref:N-acetyl-gamma-glutamyl-phosphate reductase n=1 Tax=Corynebacterium epidermidicanis TaxID=1050174 RepID=A0A0G3GPE1_9CORY|nr:N-acetyl-gamma-glutamyl-phosphate reductase [Corynebacterium epidermidicanis]AKK03029.1 N-acetyl-gamma-glutamyl-phosphate reductase [Corynebacterium epidermidicanis]
MSISVAIAGVTGYAGAELLRLLVAHPAYASGELTIGALAAGSSAGQQLGELLPHLPEFGDRVVVETSAETLGGHDVVFLALPHGHSAALAHELDAEVSIIDCAADFRLRSAAEWEKYYGSPHAGSWVYGLPEMPGHRDAISQTGRVAVPGCFPTGATMALMPAVHAGLIQPNINVVSITGVSGAGKKASVGMLGAETMSNVRAYNTAGKHRHTPEIKQNLGEFIAADIQLSFTPVLAPMPRGILTTATAPLAAGVDAVQARATYEDFYADETFVTVLPEGYQPQTKSVVGSNGVQVQVEVNEDAGLLLVTSAIDNLTKGTAGGAVQCMNLMHGFPETAGLPVAGLAP